MYKVILVDDERIIRQGLKKLIDWTEIGFEIIDEASDGLTAIDKIKNLKPDLVLLDIRMPGLDGISLLKKLRQEKINCKVIFLTGYGEFEYAKQAIPLNVEAFITKPIDEVELKRYLVETHKKIQEDYMINSRLDERVILEEKHAMRRLLFGHKLNRSQLQIEKGTFTVVEIQLKNVDHNADIFFDNYQNHHENVSCLLIGNSWVLVVKDLSLSRVKVLLYDLSIELEKRVSKDFFISVGRQVNSIHGIKNSFEDVKLLGQRWFLDDQDTIVYFDTSIEEKSDNFYIDVDLLLSYIEVNNTSDIDLFFDILEGKIRAQHIEFNKIKSLCVNCLLILIERVRQNYSIDSELLKNELVSGDVYSQSRLSHLIDCMKKYITMMQNRIHDGSRTSTMVRLLDYIGTHYDKNLKLERLGQIFGYNSSYLGTIFKEHTGMSYSKYLDLVRIEEAKKLLKEHNNKVYEIAEIVGYNSVDYFHGKFKKYVSMSPKQYQLEHKNSNKIVGESYAK